MAAQRLTRKHFQQLAGAIAGITDSSNNTSTAPVFVENALQHAQNKIASDIADICEPLNAGFDRRRFIEACVGKNTPKALVPTDKPIK